MTYRETLSYLFEQLPMYQRIGQAAYKADLSNTHALMDMLDHPERDLKCIHIAGTNGKGSCAHLLASVFQEAGYKTGLYTSPHLIDFRERILVNGAMISKAHVMDFVASYRERFESVGLSFFEWSVGLAFHHFREQQVDIAIVEVGMGGRLDSTNVLTPDLSIITNIGLDHAAFLGEDHARIAREKAGIIKREVPVVIGKSQRETEGIFRSIALGLDCTITFADQQFPEDVPECPLSGNYQKENFQTVLVSLEELRNRAWEIPDDAIDRGFKNVLDNTRLRGRWELIRENPGVICDVAHNKEGLEFVCEQLHSIPYERLHLVLGFVSDKAVSELLALFPADASFYLCEPGIPRAMPLSRLSQLADEQRIAHNGFESVEAAYKAALAAAQPKDLIYVGGSTFTVADLLGYLDQAEDVV